MTSYALARIRTATGIVDAIMVEDRFYRLDAMLSGRPNQPLPGAANILDDWERVEPALAAAVGRVASGAFPEIATPRPTDFAPPVAGGGKIVCTGTNYYDHLRKDMNIHDFDKSKHDILFFQKHAGAAVGSGAVRYPTQTNRLDWEVELVVVFGKRGRRIPAAQALDHVAGYAVGMDLSARDWQFNPRHLKQFDLFMGKSFDDSSPIGPYFVPARFVDPTDLMLRLWVNGDLKQDSHTREMIWSIEEQIAELSQAMTIEPGDLLYTGSPGGVGFASGTFLKRDDRVEAEISGLGKLVIDIVADPDEARARRP